MARNRARSRSARRQHSIGKALVPSTVSAGANRGTQPTATPFPLFDLLNSSMSTSPFPVRPLPRDPYDRLPFGPLEPLAPDPISPVIEATGQPEAWITQYPVGFNIPGQDYREIPWSILYDASTGVDVIRRCIEIRKSDITSLKWAWQVRPEVISQAYLSDQTSGKADVERALREQWAPEIDRLNRFWIKPWPTGEYTFTQWIKMVLDQVMVLDALAIYPRSTFGGDLLDLEVIDGSTIKPLLDYRGSRPTPPNPAFQQILYGFPRGEWTAATSIDANGNEIINDGYLAGQLYYRRNNPRAQSPYGLSPVEQALVSARTYLARQGWMISEYADGATPTLWLQPQAGAEGEIGGLNLRQRREWQNAINDELSGQTRARHRIKVGIPGHVPTPLQSADERYKPDYDLYLIKLVAMHFGVPITKLGFSEAKGLGSSGHSQAQLSNAMDLGQDPDVQMLTEIINELSAQFLRAPAELTFAFVDPDDENAKDADAIADAQLKRGSLTWNEDRRRLGLPTYDFDGADEPVIVTATGPTFVADALAAQRATSAATIAQATATVADPTGAQAAADLAAAQGNKTPDDGTAEPPSSGQGDDTGDTTKAAGPDHEVAQAVIDQLSPDYPLESLAWVHGAHWRGPVPVPLSKVDFDDASSWDASTGDADADKIKRFAGYVKQGRMKPVVMVQVPGEDKYRVIDGHHRTLAYQSLGRQVLAYVGKVGAKVGPWTEMHALQHSTDNPMSVSAPPAMKSAEMDDSALKISRWRERQAYKRFTAKAPSRDFAFEWHTPEEAELIKFGTFVESEHPRGPGGQFGAGTPGPAKHGAPPHRISEGPAPAGGAPKRGTPPRQFMGAGARAGGWHPGQNASHVAPTASAESAAQFNADQRSARAAAEHASRLMAEAKARVARLKGEAATRAAHEKLTAATHGARTALSKAHKAAEAYAAEHHLHGAQRKAYVKHAIAKEQAAYDKAKAASAKATAKSKADMAARRAAALASAEAAAKGVDADLTKVGPHGYEHGWIFVGVPGVGKSVYHPRHGRGVVTSHDGGHVGVDFNSGHKQTFEARHDPSAPGDFRQSEVKPIGEAGRRVVAQRQAKHDENATRARARIARETPALSGMKGTDTKIYRDTLRIPYGKQSREVFALADESEHEGLRNHLISYVDAVGDAERARAELDTVAPHIEALRRGRAAHPGDADVYDDAIGAAQRREAELLAAHPVRVETARTKAQELREAFASVYRSAGKRKAASSIKVPVPEHLTSTKALEADLTKVGPKGYIHGWIFVGIPGVGARVFHPHHGRGTITGHDGGHVSVKFDSGKEHSFQARHDPSATGDFAEHTTVPSVTEQNRNRLDNLKARVGRGAKEREPVTDPLDKARMRQFREDASKRTYESVRVTRRDLMLEDARKKLAEHQAKLAEHEAAAKANFKAEYARAKRRLQRKFPGETEHINTVLAGRASWADRDPKLEEARAALDDSYNIDMATERFRADAQQQRIDELEGRDELPRSLADVDLSQTRSKHKLTAQADPERPLSVYGDLLTIHDDNEMTHHHLLDLQTVDPHVHRVVAKHLAEDFTHEDGKQGAGVYVGSQDVTKLDDLKDLDKDMAARQESRPGVDDTRLATEVGGLFQGYTGKVAIGHANDWMMADGVTRHHSTARHELGHAYDSATEGGRASQTDEFKRLYQSMRDDQPDLKSYNKAGGYFLGDDHHSGRQETFAEAFSLYHSVVPELPANRVSEARTMGPEEIKDRRVARLMGMGMARPTAEGMTNYFDGLTMRARAAK